MDRLTAARSRTKAEQLTIRCNLEDQKLQTIAESQKAQLAAQEAELARLRAVLDLKKQQVESLKVRAGIDGVLQRLGETTGPHGSSATSSMFPSLVAAIFLKSSASILPAFATKVRSTSRGSSIDAIVCRARRVPFALSRPPSAGDQGLTSREKKSGVARFAVSTV